MSRAQPPEDNRRKPVLGKLGTLFTAGRRNIRNGVESPGQTSSNTKSLSPKDGTSSKLPERVRRAKYRAANYSKRTPARRVAPQEAPLEAEAKDLGGRIQATPIDAELSPASGSSAAVVQQCHDSPQLEEPLQAGGETFPDATIAAKQLHSSPGNSSRQENAETPARSPGEDALPSTGPDLETAPGWPTGAGLGDPPAQGSENRAGSGEPSGTARPGDRAHPAKVLTLDSYLSKTEAGQVDEPVVIIPGAEDCGYSDDMEKRSSGPKSGRRRKSQKSTDFPGADTALPESPARDDAVFDDEVAPKVSVSAEKKVISLRAALEVGVDSTASPESKPGPKGQLRGELDRGKQPPQTSSPTKRKGRSRAPEPLPSPPASVPLATARESPPKRAPAPDPGPKSKGALADCGEEAARVIPRELTVKSSSLLPEIKPEHKRGPVPNHFNHFDGRGGEGGRSKEQGRSAGASEADGLKPRNHFGVGRSTVTTKVTL
ncbi:Absent in melanoma 1 protein [Fukomys damarensis]|uniref:Absent in melanoma 1 protein n=1 Tax=Fukomys damarensis TaxID=885580 RepID=A0A091CTN5_FUKDA|nr:Absent in melanoma 1 protein [Fukomys damarensis]